VLDRLPQVCQVGVFDGKSINYFYIFFSRGRNIRVNRAVKALSSDFSWTGDILIVRGSARFEGVVNMRGDDRKLADFALKKYVFLVQYLGTCSDRIAGSFNFLDRHHLYLQALFSLSV